MAKLLAYLRLMRPANIVTAFADILAGFGIVAIPYLQDMPGQWFSMLGLLLLLLLSTAGLYGGGVVFNDVFDASLDKIERPERPIPRGVIKKIHAGLLATLLLLLGIAFAWLVSRPSGIIAACIALLTLTYDAYFKHHLWLGPVNMALCRAGNLLLGMSILPQQLVNYWMLMLIGFCFVIGITFISKGEVSVTNRKLLWLALAFYIAALLGVLSLAYLDEFKLLYGLPFLFIFAVLAFSSLIKALVTLEPHMLRKAVKIGILCLIILDAAIAAGFAGWWYGLLMLVLLPISITLAKTFAIT